MSQQGTFCQGSGKEARVCDGVNTRRGCLQDSHNFANELGAGTGARQCLQQKRGKSTLLLRDLGKVAPA